MGAGSSTHSSSSFSSSKYKKRQSFLCTSPRFSVRASTTTSSAAAAPAASSSSSAGEVDSADIVLQSSQKSRVKSLPGDEGAQAATRVHRMVQSAGEFDEIVTWLDYEFCKHDLNKDGFLDYHEFVNFVRSLNLNMNTKEIFQFFVLADRDNDYRIVWAEIEADVPRILAKIYEDLPPSANDWCLMTTPDGTEVYFNKRTSTVSKGQPVVEGASADASAGAAGAALDAGKKQQQEEEVLENTKTFDVAITWLDWVFRKADWDNNGVLTRNEFSAFVHGLRIGLNETEVAQFCKLADANGDGVVEWVEVLELTPLILRKLYTAIPPGPHDWCKILDGQGASFYLNKRKGTTVTGRPPDYREEEEEEETDNMGEKEKKKEGEKEVGKEGGATDAEGVEGEKGEVEAEAY